MVNRKYYLCSVGEIGKGYDSENWIRCMTNTSFFFNEKLEPKGKIEKVQKNDLLLLIYKTEIVAYGIASDSLQTKSLEEDWKHYIKVRWWKIGDPVSIEKNLYNEVVVEINRDFALQKIEEMNLI